MPEYTNKFLVRFWAKVIRSSNPDDCWGWSSATSDGYGRIGFNYTTLWAHRVSFELAYGPLLPGQQVLHKCDNPPCCNPRHLFVGTDLDNAVDRETKGRGNHVVGEKHGRHKLSDADVAEIRRLYATGNFTQKDLAKIKQVSQTVICFAINRKTWK